MTKDSLLILKKLMEVIGRDSELDAQIQAAIGVNETNLNIVYAEIFSALAKDNKN